MMQIEASSRWSPAGRKALRRALEQALERAGVRRHRCVICTPPAPRSLLAPLVEQLRELAGEALVQPDPAAAGDRGDQLAALLGSECRHVRFEPRAELDAGLLATVSGTLRAGGVLHVCLPRDSADPFIQRLTDVMRRQARPLLSPRVGLLAPAWQLLEGLSESTDAAPQGDADAGIEWQTEQDKVLASLTHRLTSQPRRGPECIVVQGRRGRGKSSLLGRLAARLASAGADVRIVAEQPGARDIIQRHWHVECRHLGLPEMDLPRLSLQMARQEMARQATTRTDGRQCLLVDEAATIPLPVLADLAGRFGQLLLATTTEGYEGTGSALPLRLEPELAKRRISVHATRLVNPIRWSAGDPLERLLDRALLMNLKPAISKFTGPVALKPDQLRVKQVDRSRLQVDEPRLRQLATLLMQSHYRTTLQDLRHLLMHTPLQLHVLEHDAEPAGVALIAREGELPSDVHEPILARERRLPDQILPQLLAQCLDEGVPLTLRYARVVRIAVLPHWQGRGLGSHLITALCNTLQGSVDAIGASFGGDSRGLQFWLKNGFEPVHRGLQRNARSGLKAVCVLKPLHPQAALTVRSAGTLSRLNLAALHAGTGLAGEQAQDADRVLQLLISGSHGAAADPFPEQRLEAQLVRYARGQRSTLDSAAALRLRAARLADDGAVDEIDLDTGFARLLNGGSGHRALERRWRSLVQGTLPLIQPPPA